MYKIDLTPEQVRELTDHYTNEIERIDERKLLILDLFRVFGWETKDLNVSFYGVKSQQSTVNYKTKESQVLSYPKPKWSQYAFNILRDTGKSMTRDKIIEAYQKEHKFKFPDIKIEKAALNQALSHLQTSKSQIKSKARKGKRGNLYRFEESDFSTIIAKKEEEKKKTLNKKHIDLPKPEEKWIQFVLDTFNKQNRILNRNELAEYALKYFNLPHRHRISTRGKLQKVITYMRKASEQLKRANKKGQSGSYFGLNEWFDDNNKLIADYK